MKIQPTIAVIVALSACSPNVEKVAPPPVEEISPPALPEGAESIDFERPKSSSSAPETAIQVEQANGSERAVYWGVKDGEPLTLMWEDLMPEGSEEELIREYEEFYAMLEKRYAANASSLADADPYAMIAEGSEFDYMPQLGGFETVDALNEEYVRIPGYIVPFDFSSKMRQSEFLFVPYMGACIHSPPPPPNQIILVRADPPFRVKDIWAPYWMEGTLSTEKTETDLADTAYTMKMSNVEPYEMR
ncbi:MAG: DUF3299 domain-containing protein [Pseudomonadota bacterium]